MPPTILIVGFAVLIANGAVLLVLTLWMFRLLRERHPLTYEIIGSPTLFWNNSPRNHWLFLKFLFGSQWQELDDSAVAKICPFMRVLIVVYTLVFLGLLVLSFVIIG